MYCIVGQKNQGAKTVKKQINNSIYQFQDILKNFLKIEILLLEKFHLTFFRETDTLFSENKNLQGSRFKSVAVICS